MQTPGQNSVIPDKRLKRILLVDDQPDELNQLHLRLGAEHPEWQIEHLYNGPSALKRMSQAPFDAVISDLIMPEMDGLHLLRGVRRGIRRPCAFCCRDISTGVRICN